VEETQLLHALNPSIHNGNPPIPDDPVRGLRRVPAVTGTSVLFLTGLLLAAFWAGSARADELPRATAPDGEARRLAEDALRGAGGNHPDALGAWTRSILERALERAGETARRTVPGRSGEPAPLPAERHAPAIAEGAGGRVGTAELLIFTSLSVPRESWRQWVRDAAKTGAPLVLRGVSVDGLRATARRIGERLRGAEAGVAIDPRLFRLFGVTRVPAVVVVPGGVPPCASRGCAEDPAPPHDRIAGNISLAAALEAIAEEGAAGRDAARRHLQRLRGEKRP